MPIDPADFNTIVEFARKEAAITLEPGKEYLVESRLNPLVRQFQFANIGELVSKLRLQQSPQLKRACLDALTTNETSFFRDIHPFETLRTEIIPRAMANRTAERSLTIWFGACSSGQEPYSTAILLKEHFPQLATWKLNLLGFDISQSMVDRCKEGRYSTLEVNRGLQAPLLVKYFRREGANWFVNDELKSMIKFSTGNLLGVWPPTPQIDIAFLRNVLIYFDVPTKQQVLRTLKTRLRKDGVLMLGGPETTHNIDPDFERVTVGRSIYFTLKQS